MEMEMGKFNLRILDETDFPEATEVCSSLILSSKGFKVAKFCICSDM